MPSRFVSLAILIYWLVAAFCLLAWDVIPELGSGYPPDFRAIAMAGDPTRSVRWVIQVVDDPRVPDVRRLVGEALTGSSRRPDGWFELTSQVEIDAGGIMKGTALLTRSDIRLDIDSRYLIEPSGNLRSFTVDVKAHESPETLIQVKGELKGRTMEIVSHGPVEMLNKRLEIDYAPRGLVQDVLGPLDRLPGLFTGKRWETQMINPFTGQVSAARVEVGKIRVIHWSGKPVNTYEVVQQMAAFSSRTWVRTEDGLILRQEVPFPFARLVLERRPEPADLSPMP
jgi:hypothetical protein